MVGGSGLGWAARRDDLLVCPFGWLFWLVMGFLRDDQPKQDTSLKDTHSKPEEPTKQAN